MIGKVVDEAQVEVGRQLEYIAHRALEERFDMGSHLLDQDLTITLKTAMSPYPRCSAVIGYAREYQEGDKIRKLELSSLGCNYLPCGIEVLYPANVDEGEGDRWKIIEDTSWRGR
jgi:hypothetical protein